SISTRRRPRRPSRARRKRARRERSGARRDAPRLSTWRTEIAIEIGAVAHPCDTTPERRSPDHLAMTGAPVEQRVAWFERRRYGSPFDPPDERRILCSTERSTCCPQRIRDSLRRFGASPRTCSRLVPQSDWCIRCAKGNAPQPLQIRRPPRFEEIAALALLATTTLLCACSWMA